MSSLKARTTTDRPAPIATKIDYKVKWKSDRLVEGSRSIQPPQVSNQDNHLICCLSYSLSPFLVGFG